MNTLIEDLREAMKNMEEHHPIYTNVDVDLQHPLIEKTVTLNILSDLIRKYEKEKAK